MSIKDFPIAGITCELTVPPRALPVVLEGLTTCGHPHVFLVDQSRTDGNTGMVRFGLSDTGLRCSAEALERDGSFGPWLTEPSDVFDLPESSVCVGIGLMQLEGAWHRMSQWRTPDGEFLEINHGETKSPT